MNVKNINILGQKCDVAILQKNEQELDICIFECKKFLQKKGLKDGVKKYLNYWLGNLFSCKSSINLENIQDWKNRKFPAHLVECINYHRKAFYLDIKSPLHNEVKTNLANELERFDRVIEAIDLWNCDFSLSGDAPFVSSYYKGFALWKLSEYINDPGHAERYQFEAYKIFKKLSLMIDKSTHKQLAENFKNDKRVKRLLEYGDTTYKSKKNLEDFVDTEIYSKEELNYREWCLKNKLFLSHLNDLTTSMVASQDIIQFPTHSTRPTRTPYFSAAFSAIKREYCFARFMAFEAVNEIHPSYENKKLYLVDTLDWVRYEGHIEKLKTSLRLAFSALDSLANLMHHYFLNKKPTGYIYFTGEFIREKLHGFDNEFINSLYWLAIDLTDNDKGKMIQNWSAPNPDGKMIRKVRNAMEHNWLRVSDRKETKRDRADFANFVITSDELKDITLKTFKFVRSALLYFVLAVKVNEDSKKDDQSKLIISQQTPMYNGSYDC